MFSTEKFTPFPPNLPTLGTKETSLVLTSPRLLVLNPMAAPENVQRRSVLYIMAFCALAASIVVAAFASPSPNAEYGSSFWLLCLLALFTGVMALCVRRTHRVDPTTDNRNAPTVHASPPDEGLSGFAAWRTTRVDKLSEFKLESLPPPATLVVTQPESKRPADKSRKDAVRDHDPWARALEDHERRKK